jgi:hypothetical protein
MACYETRPIDNGLRQRLAWDLRANAKDIVAVAEVLLGHTPFGDC